MPHLKISVISGVEVSKISFGRRGLIGVVSALRRPKSPEVVVLDSGSAQKMQHGSRACPFDRCLQELAFSNGYTNVILYCVVCPINVDSL
jgi:hypothetical protein